MNQPPTDSDPDQDTMTFKQALLWFRDVLLLLIDSYLTAAGDYFLGPIDCVRKWCANRAPQSPEPTAEAQESLSTPVSGASEPVVPR